MPLPGQKQEEPVIRCEGCGCSWFEHLTVKQYNNLHSVVFGQKIPFYSDMEFYLLRCIKCGKLHVPSVSSSRADKVWKQWNELLDELGLQGDPLNEFQTNQFKPILPSGNE